MAKTARTKAPEIDGQTQVDTVWVEDDELLLALDTREKHRKAVAEHRKATAILKEIIAERSDLAGAHVRCGRWSFEVVKDPGGDERQGYVTKGGIKAKKIKAVE